MKGKLRKEFIEWAETELDRAFVAGMEQVETELDRDFIVGVVEDLIHDLCDEIEDRLGSILGDMVDIRGITEINDIRNNLQELMDDLW